MVTSVFLITNAFTNISLLSSSISIVNWIFLSKVLRWFNYQNLSIKYPIVSDKINVNVSSTNKFQFSNKGIIVISDAAINMLAKALSNSDPIAAPSILNIFSHHS